MHPIDLIRKFARLTPELEESLRSVMCEHHFRKGDTIRGTVNLTTFAYYISKGSARVYYTHKSKEHTFEFAFENEFITVSRSMARKLGDTLTIQFLEPTSVIFMPHLRMKELLGDSGTIDDTAGLIFMSTALMQYADHLEERVGVMQSLGADERYRWILHRYPRITECANATQIASFLGITKETLYRIRNGKYGKPQNETDK